MSTIGNEADAAGAAVPLDMLLTQAALGTARRLAPGGAGLRFLSRLARRPDKVAVRVRGLVGQLAQIAVGTSELTPSTRDRRFADPAWAQNPVLRRLVQAHLALQGTAEGLLSDVPL